MKLDRDLQRDILHQLKNVYGMGRHAPDIWATLQALPGGEDEQNLLANVLYLEEQGLLTSGVQQSVDGFYSFNEAGLKITCKGLDFLEDDGGLGAILNCVTVKLHDESLARLEAFVRKAPIEAQAKAGYLARLQELPADATKHLLLKLLEKALDNVPVALQLLQKALV